jgi:NADPH2:quinone reductase
VPAVVSSPDKRRTALLAGADEVFPTDAEWRARVVAASGGGVDVVFDPVGGDRFADSVRSLRTEGRLVVVGFASGQIPQILANRLLFRSVDVCGCSWSVLLTDPDGLTRAAAELEQMVGDGHVRPVIGSVHPIEEAAAALRELDTRRAAGKVVLTLD